MVSYSAVSLQRLRNRSEDKEYALGLGRHVENKQESKRGVLKLMLKPLAFFKLLRERGPPLRRKDVRWQIAKTLNVESCDASAHVT